MHGWHAAFLGRRRLPRALSAFELEAFVTFTGAERRAIEHRRTAALRLGLALQLGFLRMCGQPLAAVGAVPPALWRHLGTQFEVTAPDLASLRVMYRRLSTLYEHQELACGLLGFRDASDAQRRALVRVVRDELARTADRARLLAFTYAWLYERRLTPPRERDLRRLVLLAIPDSNVLPPPPPEPFRVGKQRRQPDYGSQHYSDRTRQPSLRMAFKIPVQQSSPLRRVNDLPPALWPAQLHAAQAERARSPLDDVLLVPKIAVEP